MSESKHARFERIATNRTNKIIDTLRLLGNCSNRSNYEYSEEEVSKIFNAIEHEIKLQKSRFASTAKSQKFKL